MKQIKRFELQVEPIQKVLIPFNSEVLGVNHFENKPCLLAIVDMDHKGIEHTIIMLAENKDMDYKLNKTNYIGRFFHEGHTLHVFDNN